MVAERRGKPAGAPTLHAPRARPSFRPGRPPCHPGEPPGAERGLRARFRRRGRTDLRDPRHRSVRAIDTDSERPPGPPAPPTPRIPHVFGSYPLGSVFGIPIRLHRWMPPLLLLVLALSGWPWLITLTALLMLMAVVGLHELGHGLVAQRFGIRVVDITFWPLGGLARMGEFPEDPRIESAVAFAGPAVNFVLAALGMFLMSLFGLGGPIPQDGLGYPILGPEFVLQVFVAINMGLGIFNLLPAFPMDGGRILRSFLGRNGNWLQATESAVRVGRTLAFTLFVLWIGSWLLRITGAEGSAGSLASSFRQPGLPLIAIFIWFSGGYELIRMRMRHAAQQGQGAPFSFGNFQFFGQGGSGQGGSGQGGFGQGGSNGPFPFGGFPGGVADSDGVREVEVDPVDSGAPPGPVDVEAIEVEAQRASEPPRVQGGLDERTVEDLERFRGRLPRLRRD